MQAKTDGKILMNSFYERFLQLSDERSPLCLGLDPSRELMRDWGLSDDAEGLHRFCGVVMEAAGDRIAVVKPQSGFFERLGPPGLSELAKVVATIREQGALSIIDCKRGDVIETMEGYAEAMLGPAQRLWRRRHDGNGLPRVRRAAPRPRSGRSTAMGRHLLVVQSSNSEGCSVQNARLADGRTVADALADEITAFNAALGDHRSDLSARSWAQP